MEKQLPIPTFWRSWLLRAPVLMLLWVLILRLGWGAYFWKQWQSGKSRMTANGFVFEPPAPSADSDQIEDAIDSAVKAIVFEDSPSGSVLQFASYPPYSSSWWTLAEKSESKNKQAIALARSARLFIDRTPGPMTIRSVSYPKANGYSDRRSLANILGDSMIRNHLVGNDAEAIQQCEDILAMASVVRRESSTISQLVALGLDSLATERGEIVGAGLVVGNPSASAPASKQQVRALLRRVLDEEDIWRNMAVGEAQTPTSILLYAEQASKDTWLIKPLVWRDYCKFGAELGGTIAAFKLRDGASREQYFPNSPVEQPLGLPQRFQRDRRYTEFYSAYTRTDQVKRLSEAQLRLIGERRTLAVSLAMRLYLADEGHLPKRLEDLAPKYLPTVPKDPFFNDGRTIGMQIFPNGLPGGGDRVMIYFDPAHLVRQPLPTPMFGWNQDYERKPGDPQNEIRQWCDVTRWYVSPATRATDILPPTESDKRFEDDARKADGQGEQADPGENGE